jgi:4-hydroxybutyrate CoA-transferase
MASWQSIYQSRVTTAEEAMKVVKSGQRVFLTGNVSIPKTLLGALVKRAPELENV